MTIKNIYRNYVYKNLVNFNGWNNKGSNASEKTNEILNNKYKCVLSEKDIRTSK